MGIPEGTLLSLRFPDRTPSVWSKQIPRRQVVGTQHHRYWGLLVWPSRRGTATTLLRALSVPTAVPGLTGVILRLPPRPGESGVLLPSYTCKRSQGRVPDRGLPDGKPASVLRPGQTRSGPVDLLAECPKSKVHSDNVVSTPHMHSTYTVVYHFIAEEGARHARATRLCSPFACPALVR